MCFLKTFDETPKSVDIAQGPVVQSIVSLTNSLIGQLVNKYTDIFVVKMREAFALTFFQQKYWRILILTFDILRKR